MTSFSSKWILSHSAQISPVTPVRPVLRIVDMKSVDRRSKEKDCCYETLRSPHAFFMCSAICWLLLGRVLVVEDDSAVQRALKHLLEAEGYAVEIHGNGQSALESFHAFPPAIIVLDLVLNLSHTAVKARLWRARLQLREGLNKYFSGQTNSARAESSSCKTLTDIRETRWPTLMSSAKSAKAESQATRC